MNHVLRYDRIGAEPWEFYCFIHGLPTRHVGSWLPDEARPTCGEKSCEILQEVTWPKHLLENHMSWAEMKAMECAVCQAERQRRCQVLTDSTGLSPGQKKAEASEVPQDEEKTKRFLDFAGAPYIHPYNQPKYHALICHAVHFAEVKSQQVFWCVAQDWPITSEEEALSQEQLQALRESWLLAHDQKTNGIMGLLPLVINMPIRFTDTVDREKKIFKQTTGILKKIRVSEEERKRIMSEVADETQIVLKSMPKALTIEILSPEDVLFEYELKSEFKV